MRLSLRPPESVDNSRNTLKLATVCYYSSGQGTGVPGGIRHPVLIGQARPASGKPQERIMRTEKFDCAHEAFTFIENLERLQTVDEVISSLEGSLALFGFENFI